MHDDDSECIRLIIVKFDINLNICKSMYIYANFTYVQSAVDSNVFSTSLLYFYYVFFPFLLIRYCVTLITKYFKKVFVY